MNRLSQNKLSSNMGSIVPIAPVLSAAVTQRGAFMLNKSGYPEATHLVNELMRGLDPTSIRSLNQSFMYYRNTFYFAATVLESIPLTRIEKYIFSATDIETHTAKMIGENSSAGVDVEDSKFIAKLITAAELNDGAWVLNFSSQETKNLHIKFMELYKKLISTVQPVGNDNTGLNYLFDADMHVLYDPGVKVLVSYNDLKGMSSIIKDARERLGNTQDEGISDNILREANEQIAGQIVQYNLAHLRIIDHAYMLLNDTAIWGAFIAPRLKADAATNIERAKSLRLGAAYFHSLLMYPYMFNMELFLGSYERLQSWMAIYPSLPAEVMTNYENVVRAHDFLGAKADVALVLSKLDQAHEPDEDCSIKGIPREVIGNFGLQRVVTEVEEKMVGSLPPINFSDFKTLDRPEYRYILMSFPVTNFDMMPTLSEFLFGKGVVSSKISAATAAMSTSMQMYYRDETKERLRALSPRIPFEYSNNIPMTDDINRTSSYVLENGTVKWRPLSPRYTYEFEKFMRVDKQFYIFSAHTIIEADKHKFMPEIIVNKDHAKRLRGILLKEEWKTLMPSDLFYGDEVWTHDSLKSSAHSVMRLFERLFGMNYEILIRQMDAPYIKELIATFISGFACYYVNGLGGDVDIMIEPSSVTIPNTSMLNLVTGHGLPYGCTYQMMADLQGPVTPEKLIKVGRNTYIRIYDKIPKPSDNLCAVNNFYGVHPYYYYPSNAGTISVERWVMTEGMLNFSFCPVFGDYSKAIALLDQRRAYVNDKLYAQANLMYRLGATNDGENSFTIPLVNKHWSQTLMDANLEYITHGNYVTAEFKLEDTADLPLTKLISDIEKEGNKIDSERPENKLNEVKPEPIKDLSVDSVTIGNNEKEISGGNKSRKANKKKKPNNPVKKEEKEDKDFDKLEKNENLET